MSSSYQPNIPTGTIDLDVDYQNIQGNFQQLDTTYSVDHVAFSLASNNGYHKVIRMVPNVGGAPTIPNIGQLFDRTINDGYDTDEILYFKTGLGKVLQLTSNFVPTSASPGATFLPGGIVIQWGTAPGAIVAAPITFLNGGFNNLFVVLTSGFNGSNNTSVSFIKTQSATGFTYISTYPTMEWIAIGN